MSVKRLDGTAWGRSSKLVAKSERAVLLAVLQQAVMTAACANEKEKAERTSTSSFHRAAEVRFRRPYRIARPPRKEDQRPIQAPEKWCNGEGRHVRHTDRLCQVASAI